MTSAESGRVSRLSPDVFVAAGLFCTLWLLFHETILSIVLKWVTTETFAHGVIILPVCLALIWRRNGALQSVHRRPAIAGVVAIAVLSVVWFLGYTSGVQVVRQFSVALMIPSIVIAVFGFDVARVIRFPLFYLMFAVPFGEFLIAPLMNWTADFTVWMLEVTGTPVYREGLYFATPGGQFEVAKACSGIRYLLVSIALGALFAYLYLDGFRQRLLLILASIAIPIFANGLRAYLIVLIAGFWNIEFAESVDHIIFGWIFFGIVMFFIFLFGKALRKYSGALLPLKTTASSDSGRIRESKNKHSLPLIGVLSFAAMSAGTVAGQVLAASLADSRLGGVSLPSGEAGWVGRPAATTEWAPVFQGFRDEVFADYERRKDIVNVAAVRYVKHVQGQELVSSINLVFNPDVWRKIAEHSISVEADMFTSWKAWELHISREGEDRLVWYWYNVMGEHYASPVRVKVAETMYQLRGINPVSSLVLVSTSYRQDQGLARDRLRSFVNDMIHGIDRCILATTAGAECSMEADHTKEM